jgi:hypothetical protein
MKVIDLPDDMGIPAKLITCSEGRRSAVPLEAGRPFRRNPISRSEGVHPPDRTLVTGTA